MSKKTHLPTPPPPPRTEIVLPLLAGLGTFLAFSPALHNAFLAWDDVDNFVNNLDFRGLGLKHLWWMLTTYHMGPYQPLSWLTHAIDFKIWGMDPFGYHLTNLLFHSVNAVLFYFLTRRVLSTAFASETTGRELSLPSFFAALFFSIHPMRVESVAWATERRDVLSGLFFILAVLCYLARWENSNVSAAQRKYYWGSVLLFALGLLSKATTVGLIWVLIALDVYPLKRLPLDFRRWWDSPHRPVLLEKIPFVLLGAAAVINGLFGVSAAMGHYPIPTRLSFSIYGSIFYLQKTFWPGRLSPLYELPLTVESMAGAFKTAGFLFIAITAGWVALRKRFPGGLLAWICYLLILAPVSGLKQNGPQLVAARYSYLACLPWALLCGAGFMRAGRRPLLQFAAALALCGLGWMSWNQTHLWHDDVTLWTAALDINPQNSRAHNNLGAALAKRGKTDEAVEHYQKALEINPTLAEAYRDMGLVLAERGKLEDAVAYYKKAEEIRSDLPEVHTNLAAAYYKLGKLDDAIAHYHRALDLHTPHLAETYSNLALALVLQKKMQEAIPYYQKAKALRPDLPQIHNNLATALASVGRKEEAIDEARQAIQLKPDYAKAHYTLGKLLADRGEFAEADEHLRKAQQAGLTPSTP